MVLNVHKRLEELGLEGARVRRELSNPLYSVSSSKQNPQQPFTRLVRQRDGSLVLSPTTTSSSSSNIEGWKDSTSEPRNDMQGNLEILQKEEEDVDEAVKGNTRALNESLGLLQKFEGWMDRLLQEKDDLISRCDSHYFIFSLLLFPVRSSSSRSCDSSLSLTHALGELVQQLKIADDIQLIQVSGEPCQHLGGGLG